MKFKHTKAVLKEYEIDAKRLRAVEIKNKLHFKAWEQEWLIWDKKVGEAYHLDTININSHDNCMHLTAQKTIDYLKRIGEL
jgi:hypothetical protein